MRTFSSIPYLLAIALTACVVEPEDGEILDPADDPEGLLPPEPGVDELDWHDESFEPEYLLTAATTVGGAVNAGCSTASVKGLSLQIADEMVCMSPNAFAKFTAGDGISFTGSAVLPYMAPKALTALKKAAQTTPLQINSGFRTVAQQYLLYRWAASNRCGIAVAAKPGNSNHETGRAVDIQNYSQALAAMKARGWSHNVPGDPVHFDFLGAPDLRGLDVKAFQRLWNRNHPTKKISEDGVWGNQTAGALSASPAGGFAKGATCGKPPAPPPPPPPPPSAGAIIVDSDPAKNNAAVAKVEGSGTWTTSTSAAGIYGGSYRWAATEAVSDGLSFWFYLPAAGTRTIDAWWTEGANRSPGAPYVVMNAAGQQLGKTAVDQRDRGGQWNALGTWSFPKGWNRVVLSRWAAPGSVVVGDAVRVR